MGLHPSSIRSDSPYICITISDTAQRPIVLWGMLLHRIYKFFTNRKKWGLLLENLLTFTWWRMSYRWSRTKNVIPLFICASHGVISLAIWHIWCCVKSTASIKRWYLPWHLQHRNHFNHKAFNPFINPKWLALPVLPLPLSRVQSVQTNKHL